MTSKHWGSGMVNYVFCKVNSLYLRLNLQKINVHKYFVPLETIEIHKPIYLLGLQGGGLTLLARMLKRNASVISCTGNWRQWAGDGETHNLYHRELPETLQGSHHKPHSVFGTCDMVYATRFLFDRFHKTPEDIREEDVRQYKKLIKGFLAKYGRDVDGPRFLDRSQTNTIRVTYLKALFEEEEPYFLLLVRNPYVWCKRALLKQTNVCKLNGSYEEKLRLACEQYCNSVTTCLEEANEVKHFATFRLEDLTASPHATLQRICSFLDLDLREDMLPSPSPRYHWGAIIDGKWWPLRDPNAGYFGKISERDVTIIDEHCGNIITRFDYHPYATEQS
jgi:hypothetical protein